MVLLLILAYLGIQLIISYIISKNIKTETDYFLAGKNLKLPLVAFSLFATWFGAETCIGSSAEVYNSGISGSRADPFGYSLCLFFTGLFIASKLWNGGYLTLGDFFKRRYGDVVEKVAVLILIPSSLIWAAAQVRAFGQVVSVASDLDVGTAITIASILVTVYTLLGGLLGDIYTDFIQGSVMIIGLIIIFILTLNHIPDISAIFDQMEAARFSFFAQDETLLQRMDRWMIPILGSLVAQELISRVLAAKNAATARNASFVACLMYLAMGAIPVFLGLLGPALIPGIEDSEQFLVTWAKEILPPFMYIIFAGALISAILATIDSILLAIAALVSHNILIPLLKINDEKMKLKYGRLVVVLGSILAYIIALYADGIYDLVETASSFGTAGILVITLIGLHSNFGNARSALCALFVGLIISATGEYAFDWEAPFLYAILSSLVVYILSAMYDKRPQTI